MERWYLLITENFLFWAFRWWKIRSFFREEEHEKIIFTWSFWVFHDIPGLKKCCFSYSVCGTFPWYIPRLLGKRSLKNSGEYSQIMFREYYSWNIYETFPWHISRIFRNSSKWNSGKYSQIMFWEYWI